MHLFSLEYKSKIILLFLVIGTPLDYIMFYSDIKYFNYKTMNK